MPYYDRVRVVEELLEELRSAGATVEIKPYMLGRDEGWACSISGKEILHAGLSKAQIGIFVHGDDLSQVVRQAVEMFRAASSARVPG